MMPKRTILALTAGLSIAACGGGAGVAAASIHPVSRPSAFCYTIGRNGMTGLTVGRPGVNGASRIDDRRRTADLQPILYASSSSRCRREGIKSSRSSLIEEKEPQQKLKSSTQANRKVQRDDCPYGYTP